MGVQRKVRVVLEIELDALVFRTVEKLHPGETIVQGVRSRVLERVSRMESIQDVWLDESR